MILGNNNNENQNINNNYNNFNYDKFISMTKKLFFFLFMFIILLFISYKIYFYYKEIIHIKNEKTDNLLKDDYLEPPVNIENIVGSRRKLKNTTLSNIDNEKNKNNIIMNKTINQSEVDELLVKFNGEYLFILNLSSNEYIGNWSQLSMIGNNIFDKKIDEGVCELYFHRVKNTRGNLIVNLNKNKYNSFRIDTILREGKYIDKYVKINFTFYILENIEKLLNNNSFIILYNNNTNIDYAKTYFLKDKNKEKIEKGNVTLILQKEDYSYASSYKKRIMSQFYHVTLIIESRELNVTINSIINNNDEISQKVRIYSFILSILGLCEIFHILKLIMKINEHREIGNKLSILSISINCYCKVIICIMHFFLSISITDEDMSYQFGVPTIIYFFGFTGFELKLLLLVFKIRHNGIGNQELYRKRLLCLYLFFYIFLSIMVLNIRECLTNYSLILFVYSFAWLSQIIYSMVINSRPPMSRMYIICLSLGRLYIPLYIKGLDGNIFDLKPSYLKVYLLVIITSIEIVILFLQKSFGARTILPKKYRRQGFDYYRDKVNIEQHVSKNPTCVICLENLNVDVDENFNAIKKKIKKNNYCDKIMHICFIDKIKGKINRWIKNMEGKNTKKKYMITPCDHVFHTICLEKWMLQKNECPYCKGVIPPLE